MLRSEEEKPMRKPLVVVGALLLAPVSYAGADDGEKAAMARVRLTTESGRVAGCARVGSVHDENIKDLRRKIVRAGGNTALLSFRADNLEVVYADVFRCPPPARAPASAPTPPPSAPPPPYPSR
jgi:hypothetical protein